MGKIEKMDNLYSGPVEQVKMSKSLLAGSPNLRNSPIWVRSIANRIFWGVYVGRVRFEHAAKRNVSIGTH